MGLIRGILALAFLAAPAGTVLAAPGAVQDFRLPPSPSGKAPEPARQGPVAPDVIESQRTPPPAPVPQTEAAVPVIVPALPSAEEPPEGDTGSPPSSTPRAAGSIPSERAADPSSSATVAEPTFAKEAPIAPFPQAMPPPDATSSTPVADAESEPKNTGEWRWIVAILAFTILAALAGIGLRRRTTRPQDATDAPTIERPRLPAESAYRPAEPSLPTEAPAKDNAEEIAFKLEPVRLNVTLLNAALAYRLEIANVSLGTVEGLDIHADMISAHASLGREEHLSGPAGEPEARHRIDRLEPGEHRIVEGEFRLPLSSVVPIRQGRAALFLPLARFSANMDGRKDIRRTFVIGQPGTHAGGRLQPFRLDIGPRNYPSIEQRLLA